MPKDEGGFSLPCMEDYYIAAQLRPLACWCNSNYSAIWKDLELKQCETPIQALLGNCQHHDPHLDKLNSWTRVALKVWFSSCKKLHLEKHAKILKWVSYDSEFIPSLLDKRFKQWTHNGITAYCTIVDKDGLQSFTHICKSYRLGREDMFRYFQVRDYFNKGIKLTDNKDANLISVFIDAYNAKDTKHLISQIYKRLQNSKNHSTIQVKQKWEAESGLEISEDDWKSVWAGQAKTTNSRAWREFCWKNIITFFVTPKLKFKQQGFQGQDKCWRQCGQTMADHFHIFWACPLIQPYWQDLAEEIQSILGLKVDFSFITLYLGKFPAGLMAQDNYLYKVLLAASKKAITRKWLQTNLPSKNDWITIVNEIQCMEKLTFVLRLRAEQFAKYWEKWTSYSLTCNSLSVWITPFALMYALCQPCQPVCSIWFCFFCFIVCPLLLKK